LNLGFSNFRLPKGGRLTIYPSDLSDPADPRGVRVFTAADNEAHGQLWTPVVVAADIIVELVLPRQSRQDYDLRLTSINRGYRFFGEDLNPPVDKSGSCNVDVVCPVGDSWRDEIASVGVFTIGGVWKCTGFMINNTAENERALFMTANHCGLSTGNASSLVVYWNFESPGCGQQGGGSLAQSMTGATFLSSSAGSDFALVELDDPIDPAFGISFAGWNRGSEDFSGVVGIHHPSTDEKSISFEYDPTTTTSYLGDQAPGDGTHIRVEDWDLGTTEPGSSGSPLFDLDHRVVGQLHGGYAACGNNDSDWYGRMSVSWSEISQYLDPAGTGAVTLDTHVPVSVSMKVTPVTGASFEGRVGGPFSPVSVAYLLTNNADVPLTFTTTVDVSWVDVVPSAGLIPEGETLVLLVSSTESAGVLARGQYTGTLEILNLTDGQGNALLPLDLTVGIPERIYSFDMSSDPGWSPQGDWMYGVPQGAGGQFGYPDPTAGATGTKVYGYALGGDYPNYLGEVHLVSDPLDCTGLEAVTLKFRRWLNVEDPEFDHASLAVSTDGSHFTPIWSNPNQITDPSWTLVEYDISALADDKPEVYLRWTMGTTDDSWQFSGWNIDDVEIWAQRNYVADAEAPISFKLGVANHPNPFNPVTTVRFVLDREGRARVSVHDLKGRLVRVLGDDSYAAGPHEVTWNGRDSGGRRAGSGVYLVRVVSGTGAAEHKMILLK